MGFFQGTRERVRNSRGKRAISVRATVGLLYVVSVELLSMIYHHSGSLLSHF